MESLKILIPTDFSVQAEFAYLMVKKLEEKTTIEIHFLHVLDVPDTVTMNAAGEIQTCGEIDVKYVITQKDIAARKLAKLKTLYGSHIHTHLVLGKVTDAILNFSESGHYDIIVMGTKGAWG
ncbi:MAG TPA: universal stress protein, partial [Ferruginibacter sp.]|nr:universal stress protein [Ferruginibacter sp.]